MPPLNCSAAATRGPATTSPDDAGSASPDSPGMLSVSPPGGGPPNLMKSVSSPSIGPPPKEGRPSEDAFQPLSAIHEATQPLRFVVSPFLTRHSTLMFTLGVICRCASSLYNIQSLSSLDGQDDDSDEEDDSDDVDSASRYHDGPPRTKDDLYDVITEPPGGAKGNYDDGKKVTRSTCTINHLAGSINNCFARCFLHCLPVIDEASFIYLEPRAISLKDVFHPQPMVKPSITHGSPIIAPSREPWKRDP
ncbi:hypothetical protein CAPTEDRAFT_209221 [Capitella teleta]|uniref:Uncharacterized protein n=1 Tax=Capitella teleta TaxID=283909 RepID=R7VJ63_CAPTE|nr:hypothetical protein CAPTEDRAFT_209221 [Capitella teleta]|eukprot:ELU18664.1 hypothetical protein CAPTEDRAFT_209221 [Capitella teleta]